MLAEERFKPHMPFLSEMELCERFQVNVATARKAVNQLTEEGLLYKLHRKGTFVAPLARNKLILLVTSEADYSVIGRLTPMARLFPELQWQELVVDDLRSCVPDIRHIFPRLAGTLFIRDISKCIDVIHGVQSQNVPTFFYGSDTHLGYLQGVHALLHRERDISRMALDHLLEKGCRRIGFFGSSEWATYASRQAEYIQWMGEKKLPVIQKNIIDQTLPTMRNAPACYEALKSYFKSGEFTGDGIYCVDAWAAACLVQAALAAGLRIPEDVRVISVEDDQTIAGRIFPQISCVRIPLPEDIREAVKLIAQHSTDDSKTIRLWSRPYVIARQST